MTHARVLLCVALISGGWGGSALGDTVTLRDGTQLEGIVIIEMPQKVVLKQAAGNKIISRDDIQSISKSAREEPPPPAFVARPPQSQASPAVRASIPASTQEAAANAVVKVYTTVTRPDPTKPWARLPPREDAGSGTVIEGKMILTSAHFVLYASQIQIKANQADDRIPARVVAVAPQLDLALLKIDDESFFDGHPPLPRSNALPRTRDVVSTFGYPADSTNITVIRASVTEVDFASYNYPVSGVRIRTNNDYGAGISGAPVMMGDRMIGIARRHTDASSSSYSSVVPNEEIDPFLDGFRAGGYAGKAVIGDDVQRLENPALRDYLGLDRSVHGVVVGRPDGSDGNYPLRRWDVITKIAGVSIDDLGTIPFGENGRVPFTYMTQKSGRGSVLLSLTVVRNGNEMGLSLPAEANRPMLVPNLDGAYPSYFIFGPIVFAAATTEAYALTSVSEQLQSMLAYRGSPLLTRRMDRPAFDGEQLVYVPSPFFPHKLAKGYGDPALCTVKSINGIPIRNLIHLVKVIRDSADEFIVVEFAEKDQEVMVFPRQQMIVATDGILGDNGVRSQGSPDTMAVWNQKPAR